MMRYAKTFVFLYILLVLVDIPSVKGFPKTKKKSTKAPHTVKSTMAHVHAVKGSPEIMRKLKSPDTDENNDESTDSGTEEGTATSTTLPTDFKEKLSQIGVDEEKSESIQSGLEAVHDEQTRERIIGGLSIVSENSGEFVSALISRDPLTVATTSLSIVGGLFSLSENLLPGVVGIGFDMLSTLLSAVLGASADDGKPSIETVIAIAIRDEIRALEERLIRVDHHISHDQLARAIRTVTTLSAREEPNAEEFQRLVDVWDTTLTKYNQYQHAMKNYLLAPTSQLHMNEGADYLEVFELYAVDFVTFKNYAEIMLMMLQNKTVCSETAATHLVCTSLVNNVQSEIVSRKNDAKRVLEMLHFPHKYYGPAVALYYSMQNNDKFLEMEKLIKYLGGVERNVNCFTDYNIDFTSHKGVYLKSANIRGHLTVDRRDVNNPPHVPIAPLPYKED